LSWSDVDDEDPLSSSSPGIKRQRPSQVPKAFNLKSKTHEKHELVFPDVLPSWERRVERRVRVMVLPSCVMLLLLALKDRRQVPLSEVEDALNAASTSLCEEGKGERGLAGCLPDGDRRGVWHDR